MPRESKRQAMMNFLCDLRNGLAQHCIATTTEFRNRPIVDSKYADSPKKFSLYPFMPSL